MKAITRKTKKSRKGMFAALGALFGVCLASSDEGVRAEGIDASMPVTVVVGAPRGPAPSERLNGRRNGQTTTSLPFPAVEKWKRHLGGNIDLPPVVDESGRIWVALTTPEVVVLGSDGKELIRTRIGNSAAITPPVLTSDGTFVVATTSGMAVGVSREGRLRFSTPLGARGRDLDVAPLARADGSVVFGGRSLIEVDSTGVIRARANLPERAVGALMAGPEGTIATTETGSVYVFKSPGLPRKLGSFGGPIRRGAVLEGNRTLLAVVGGKSVVGFDLPTGLLHVWVGDIGLGNYDDLVTLHPKGFALVTSSSGLMSGFDSSGLEKLRVFLDKPVVVDTTAPVVVGVPAGAAGGFFGTADAKPGPPLLVDAAGNIAFARIGGRVGVSRSNGNVALVGERLCNVPIALQPAGNEKVVLACRDGTIWMLGS